MLAHTRFLGHVRLTLALALAVAVVSVWNDHPPKWPWLIFLAIQVQLAVTCLSRPSFPGQGILYTLSVSCPFLCVFLSVCLYECVQGWLVGNLQVRVRGRVLVSAAGFP